MNIFFIFFPKENYEDGEDAFEVSVYPIRCCQLYTDVVMPHICFISFIEIQSDNGVLAKSLPFFPVNVESHCEYIHRPLNSVFIP